MAHEPIYVAEGLCICDICVYGGSFAADEPPVPSANSCSPERAGDPPEPSPEQAPIPRPEKP